MTRRSWYLNFGFLPAALWIVDALILWMANGWSLWYPYLYLAAGIGYFIALSHTSETVGRKRVLVALLLFVGLCTYSYLAIDRLIDHIQGVKALAPSLLLYLFTVLPAFVAVHYLLESAELWLKGRAMTDKAAGFE